MEVTGQPAPKILLFEKDESVAERIIGALSVPEAGLFEIVHVHRFSEGIERLHGGGIAAILLNLFLPDSEGIETFEKLLAAFPNASVLILGEDAHEAIARKAVEQGAQDYLLLGHLDTYSLPRALRNAIGRKAIEEALYVEKERALVTLNSIGDAVLCTDIDGKITYLNAIAENLTGWKREEATGLPLAEVFQIIDGSTRKVAQDPMQLAVEQNRTVGLTANCILICRDGVEAAIEDSAAPIHDRSGAVIGAVIVFHDVSAARAISLEMNHTAHHDIVTELPNRLLLNDRIAQAISSAQRHHRPFAIMFLDLDHFKYINDSLGHAIGDKLLKLVSERLVAGVRASDTVSRQGGDEFVILLPEVANSEDAAASARKLLLAISSPYFIEGKTLHINVSIGISIYPEDGEDVATLLQSADMAMYHAKESGRDNFQFFKPAMNLQAVQRQSIESGLRRALLEEEFVLHYQPKVDLRTGDITGAEALIRWHEPGGRLAPPSEFIPIAEDCGLIVQIGCWVLQEACRQTRVWQEAGLPTLTIAINVSAIEFRHKDFVKWVRTVLAETGLEARYLQLELTEGVLMKDAVWAAAVLKELKAMGVQLAVDDFGTGYSSLSYLRQFPIDVLKIDRSFIQQISKNPDDSTLVSAMIGIGQSLKHLVVAEGVETPEQKEYLRNHHCDEGQGYFFSKPIPAQAFTHLLKVGVISESED
jgi:diguanylate cyclase (GGDEF)-like protein/PAS domain S-box-containing protein